MEIIFNRGVDYRHLTGALQGRSSKRISNDEDELQSPLRNRND